MKIQKSKVLSFIMLLVLCFLFASLSIAAEITIKAGTPVPVKLEQELTSENATAGQTVRFSVTKDITVDGIVVIKAGSEVVGEVALAQKTGTFGKEGKLSIVVRHATAVDGTMVPLRSTLSKSGEEKMAVSFLFCPFIKGTSSEIPVGTESKAYVDYDTKIHVK